MEQAESVAATYFWLTTGKIYHDVVMEPSTEVQTVCERVGRWAASRADICCVALVGSWARSTATRHSDIDLIVLSDCPGYYTDSLDWIREQGAERPTRTEAWGSVTERRLALPSGMELDVGIAPRSWARLEPVDKGTRPVVLGCEFLTTRKDVGGP